MKRYLTHEQKLWLQGFELSDFGNYYWVRLKYKIIKYLLEHCK